MVSKSRIVTILAFGAVLVCSLACKKSDSDTSLPSLDGTLTFKSIPLFVNPQQEVTFVLNEGITHPEGGTVGYSYTITEGSRSVKDTLAEGVMSFTYKFCDRSYFDADTLRAVTVSATAFADGYYSSYTGSQEVEIVKGGLSGGSISGILLGLKDTSFVDSGTGTRFYASKVGDVWWLKRNVASEDKGMPYVNAPAMLDVFGSYLNWEDAKNSCPDGWTLPAEDDWVALGKVLGAENAEKGKPIEGIAGKLMVDATYNYEEVKLWNYWPKVKITNESGLSVLPVGYANLSAGEDGQFIGLQEFTAFWTADECDDQTAYCRYIWEESPDLQIGAYDKKSFGASVRCIKK